MFKKVLIIILMFFSFSISVFAAFTSIPLTEQQAIYKNLTDTQKTNLQEQFNLSPEQLKANLNDKKDGPITKAARGMSDENDKNDISKTDFIIEVNKISPGDGRFVEEEGGTAKGTAQNVLKAIIENLMIAFGVLALLVMTIGGGYMIMYHGQDELLSKGKSIFNSGLIALVVALSAGMLVKLVAYLLY